METIKAVSGAILGILTFILMLFLRFAVGAFLIQIVSYFFGLEPTFYEAMVYASAPTLLAMVLGSALNVGLALFGRK